MGESVVTAHGTLDGPQQSAEAAGVSSLSLREFGAILVRRSRFVLGVLGGLLALCAAYCALGTRVYEATARVALRGAPVSVLEVSTDEQLRGRALGTSDTQLETLATVLRSDKVSWRVIRDEKLYLKPAFAGGFARRFPSFRPDAPTPEQQTWLLERFQRALNVRTLPRTTIVQIRFRSSDPALSAAIANAQIRAYIAQQIAERVAATSDVTGRLSSQLTELKARVDADNRRLIEFQSTHGLVDTPRAAGGQQSDVEHNPALVEIDELGRELVAAKAERILRETQYKAALRSGPEPIMASDPRLQSQNASFATSVLGQLRSRRSELEQEESQLRAEHGPNFPRVVEIRAQMADADRQIVAQDRRLIRLLYGAWKAAADRERLVAASLKDSTVRGTKLNSAATTYAMMREEADRSQELYLTEKAKAQEAGLTAGLQSSNLEVVDWARQPLHPVRPNWTVDLALTFFVGLWLAIGGAFLLEAFRPRAAAVLLLAIVAGATAHAQAPTPNTSGLPSGVAHLPLSHETRSTPDPASATPTWANPPGTIDGSVSTTVPMAAPIAPSDILEASEFHTPEFHVRVRVSIAGTVVLPLVGEIAVAGKDEVAAAHAVDAALIAGGMLLHPQVTLMVVSYAGQDVTVLGEVARPGVYPYAVHHRLLDLISAAAGFTPAAGRLVTITHRNAALQPQAVALDGAAGAQNPELLAGDTVEVQRAGLIYVVGDVMRPGGFPVDPRQKLTIVQALTLAWGPTQNAALGKALLIREQAEGRTVTTLNLKRLLRGQDPDLPVQDRDILFVPDSTAKNLWNRTAESVVQSAVGVSIYAGLVYSQRF